MDENYAALAVSILTGCTPEMAFERLEQGAVTGKTITRDDVNDMKLFKARGMTYKEIAVMYGVPWTTVYGRIRPRRSTKAG